MNHQESHSEDAENWKFEWNGGYSCKKVYDALTPNFKAPDPFRWIWKSRALPKHKIFFWLLLLDRLNTRDLLTRKNFHIQSTSCVLCEECNNETMEHLFFFSCEFSQQFWWRLNMEWNTELPIISSSWNEGEECR